MMKHKMLWLPMVLGLSACAGVGTQFSKMSEPVDGERARLRVAANMLVKGIPNSDCIHWGKEGAGTIFGGLLGSSGYRGRSLDMPNPHFVPKSASGEFYVQANQPIVISLVNTPESAMRCGVHITFVPEANKDYELTMLTGRKDMKTSVCSAELFDISEDAPVPVKLTEAQTCR